jgi:glycosyltransferase involved in cell wall biosynthesis
MLLYGGPASVPGLAPALAWLRLRGRGPVVTMHHVVDPSWVDSGFVRLHRGRGPVWLNRAGIASVQRLVRGLAARVVVHEPAFAEVLRGARVIQMGVETAATVDRDRARRALDLDGAGLVALCFGFLSPYKRLEIALEAAERAGAGVLLVVAGGEHPRLAPREAYGERLRERFGGARFTGRVPDAAVASWFAAADVALFLYERPVSSSGPLALAMAYGTPVLLSTQLGEALGAPPEMTTPPDPEALGARLRALADGSESLEPLRAGVRRMAEGRSWDDVARRHLDVYREVGDRDRVRRRLARAG